MYMNKMLGGLLFFFFPFLGWWLESVSSESVLMKSWLMLKVQILFP